MLNTVSKIRGQVKTTGYPQTEGLLGDCMLKYGKELGEASTFGECHGSLGQPATCSLLIVGHGQGFLTTRVGFLYYQNNTHSLQAVEKTHASKVKENADITIITCLVIGTSTLCRVSFIPCVFLNMFSCTFKTLKWC